MKCRSHFATTTLAFLVVRASLCVTHVNAKRGGLGGVMEESHSSTTTQRLLRSHLPATTADDKKEGKGSGEEPSEKSSTKASSSASTTTSTGRGGKGASSKTDSVKGKGRNKKSQQGKSKLKACTHEETKSGSQKSSKGRTVVSAVHLLCVCLF